MINSFADKELEQCWVANACGDLQEGVRARVQSSLTVLEAAACLEDVLHVPGCQLHPLHESQKGLYSLVVEGPWHLIFRYEHGAFHDIWLKKYDYGL